MKVGIVQLSCKADKGANRRRIAAAVADASRQGAQLVVLQELHDSLYFCQTEDVSNFSLAEALDGEGTRFYSEVALREKVVLVTSQFERRAAGLYHNTALVLEKDGTVAGIYRKSHIPDDPAYYEKFYFAPGDLGFHPIKTSVGCLGVQVCWDQWYPEGARLMALRGADILLYPTAIGYESTDPLEERQRQHEAWLTVQRGHAIANGLPLVAVNRVGREPDPSGQTGGIEFWGSSFACGQQGEMLFQASDREEQVAVVDIDLGRTESVRRWWPFLRDRRIDQYQPLTQRFAD